MKRNWKYSFGAIALSGAVFLTACGSEEPTTDPVVDQVDEVQEDITVDVESFGVDPTLDYQVPTPNEFIESVQLFGGEPNWESLSDVENVENYIDNKSKALNFGVYMADLTYASNYELGSDLLPIMGAANSLASDLGIASALDEALSEKLNTFVAQGQADSVRTISDNTYYEAYRYLEENDRGAILAMVVAGGWIEGIYLMTNMVNDYANQGELIDAIAGQSFTVEHIYGFMNKYSDDENVASVMKDLQPVADVLASLELVETEEQMIEEDGVMVMTGGFSITMTEEQFNQLKEEITELRSSITE